MKVDIKRLHIFEGEGKVKAAADITIGGLVTIYGCKVVLGKEDQLFLGLPQRKDPKDEKKYWPVITVENKEVMAEISGKVVEAYLEKVQPKQEEAPATPEDIAWEE